MIPKNDAKVNSHAVCDEKVKNTTLIPAAGEMNQPFFTVWKEFRRQGKRTNAKSCNQAVLQK
jgi:hypothetical protein